jgi:adenylosuccinate synthase
MMIESADVIYGLAWGDEGKGKIANALAEKYDCVCRWNGGPNAGHTVYRNGKRYKTHLVPSGIFADKQCVIGPGCVINIDKFFEEIRYLRGEGFNTSLIKIHPNAHIITQEHIEYDTKHLGHLGTTKQGIAPCYSDKMLRRGKRAKDVFDSQWLLKDELRGKILCEGAQSVWLDIDHGDYPYVTSSNTLPYSACSLGFSPHKLQRLIGVAKIYDTKSGTDPLFPTSLWDDKELDAVLQAGGEYGTTTGRKRLVNWLNLDKLIESISLSGCTELVVNKCDVLQKVGVFKLYHKGILHNFKDLGEMKIFIIRYIGDALNYDTPLHQITFSAHQEAL